MRLVQSDRYRTVSQLLSCEARDIRFVAALIILCISPNCSGLILAYDIAADAYNLYAVPNNLYTLSKSVKSVLTKRPDAERLDPAAVWAILKTHMQPTDLVIIGNISISITNDDTFEASSPCPRKIQMSVDQQFRTVSGMSFWVGRRAGAEPPA